MIIPEVGFGISGFDYFVPRNELSHHYFLDFGSQVAVP